jgi:DNA helicase-2/ATP-dependent DNA helicase PcrA
MDVLDGSRREADRSTHADDLLALEQVAALHPEVATFEAWLQEVLGRPGDPHGVQLSTVHRVKGRQWPYVLVYGASEGLLPHRLATDEEEERRVFHVAITRAVSEVVVLADPAAPSPFLDELTGVRPRGQARRPERAAAGASAAKKPAGPALPPVLGEIGLRLSIPGGLSGEIVDVAADGAVVSPGGRARMTVAWGTKVVVDGQTVALTLPADPDVREALRAWRKEVSSKDGVPAYVVLKDADLDAIAASLPRTLDQLALCRGIGPAKLDRYGDELLAVIEATRHAD